MDPLISMISMGSSAEEGNNSICPEGENIDNEGVSCFGNILEQSTCPSMDETEDGPQNFQNDGMNGVETDSSEEETETAQELFVGQELCSLLIPSGMDGEEIGKETACKIIDIFQQAGKLSIVKAYNEGQSTEQDKKFLADEMLSLQKILAALNAKTVKTDAAVSADAGETVVDTETCKIIGGKDSEDGKGSKANDSTDIMDSDIGSLLLAQYGDGVVIGEVKQNVSGNQASVSQRLVECSNTQPTPQIGITPETITETVLPKPHIPLEAGSKSEHEWSDNAGETENGKSDGTDRGGITVERDERKLSVKMATAENNGGNVKEEGTEEGVSASGNILKEDSGGILPDSDPEDKSIGKEARKEAKTELLDNSVGSHDMGPATKIFSVEDQRNIVLESTNGRAFCEGLAHVVSIMKGNNGEKKGILRLEPPELGSMKVVINSSSDEVHIHLVVERAEASNLIKGSEDVLRGALEKQGISLGSLAVDVGSEHGGNYSGNEAYHNEAGSYVNGDLVEETASGDDEAVLAVVDIEQGILHWVA